MPVRIVLLSLAAAAGTSRGQLVLPRFFAGLRGAPTGSSSSTFVRSVSFQEGSDGEMHKQIQQVTTNKFQEGSATKHSKTEVLCSDGNCHKKTLRGSSAWETGIDGNLHQTLHQEHTESDRIENGLRSRTLTNTDCVDGFCRSQTLHTPSFASAMVPMRLRAMLQRVMGGRPTSEIGSMTALPEPLTQAPVPQPPMPSRATSRFGFGMPAVLVRVMSPQRVPPAHVVAVQAPPQDLHGIAPPAQDAWGSALCLFVAAGVSSMFAALAFMKLFSRSSEARELPLGEPLFPHAHEAAMATGKSNRMPSIPEENALADGEAYHASSAQASARSAAQDYLPHLYEKASSLADARLVRAYLTRVYAMQA